MASRSGTKLSHDNYFHTVLGLMDIQTEVYKTNLDAYAPCRAKPAQTAKQTELAQNVL